AGSCRSSSARSSGSGSCVGSGGGAPASPSERPPVIPSAAKDRPPSDAVSAQSGRAVLTGRSFAALRMAGEKPRMTSENCPWRQALELVGSGAEKPDAPPRNAEDSSTLHIHRPNLKVVLISRR